MLPRSARLTSREDFTLAVRGGRRAGRGTLVVHALLPAAATRGEGGSSDPGLSAPRVGFVVGRAVGGSVERHRVIRRLRHLVRERLDRLPAGALVVVRAQASARDADADTLSRDLDAALNRLLEPSGAMSSSAARPSASWEAAVREPAPREGAPREGAARELEAREAAAPEPEAVS